MIMSERNGIILSTSWEKILKSCTWQKCQTKGWNRDFLKNHKIERIYKPHIFAKGPPKNFRKRKAGRQCKIKKGTYKSKRS